MLIDGRPIREYPLEVLRRNMGIVPQETFLFSETIRENLAFGVPSTSAEELLEAAEAAHIRREFEEFPQGFETMVGERGMTLSGGQKQRLAIARALLRRPAILILDDALASVDTYTEERILGGLRNYTATATTILISHRVSTVRNADQIAVLDHGRIVEVGRHDELLRSMATTQASTKSSNWKKSSQSPADSCCPSRSGCAPRSWGSPGIAALDICTSLRETPDSSRS